MELLVAASDIEEADGVNEVTLDSAVVLFVWRCCCIAFRMFSVIK